MRASALFVFRDSGFGIRDSGFGIRDSGFGIRDSGFGIRDSVHVVFLRTSSVNTFEAKLLALTIQQQLSVPKAKRSQISKRSVPDSRGRSPYPNFFAHKKTEPRWAPFTMRTLVIALLLSKFLFDTSRLTRTLT